jgi:hypothetical protein
VNFRLAVAFLAPIAFASAAVALDREPQSQAGPRVQAEPPAQTGPSTQTEPSAQPEAPPQPEPPPSPEESAPAEPAAEAEPPPPPQGEVYVNERYGYALRRPHNWEFRTEPGLDIVLGPADRRAEVQVVGRGLLDIRFDRIPEGPVTLSLRERARDSGDAFQGLKRCMPPALREYLQLFWLDSYVAWHTNAMAEEYADFKLESRKALQLSGHGGVELVYTLTGKRRPGTQRVKTIIVAFDERVCQISYIAHAKKYEDDLKAFHGVVQSLYLHRDRG